jgi:hypothetical protein
LRPSVLKAVLTDAGAARPGGRHSSSQGGSSSGEAGISGRAQHYTACSRRSVAVGGRGALVGEPHQAAVVRPDFCLVFNVFLLNDKKIRQSMKLKQIVWTEAKYQEKIRYKGRTDSKIDYRTPSSVMNSASFITAQDPHRTLKIIPDLARHDQDSRIQL